MMTNSHVLDQILVKVRKNQVETFSSRMSVIGLRVLKWMHLLAGDFVIVKTSPKPMDGVLRLLADLPEVEYAEPNYADNSFMNKMSVLMVDTNKTNSWEKFTVKEAAIDVIDAKIDLNLPAMEKTNYVPVTIQDLLFISNAVPVNLAEAVEAIDYATKMDVNIVSNSWVRDGFSKALDDAIKVAENKGVSFVAAASIAATIGSGMGGGLGHLYDSPIYTDLKAPSHVSAGVLTLYIAQEDKDIKSGRGRLIAKSIPSETNLKLKQQNEIVVSQNFSFPEAKFIKLEIDKLNASTNLNLIKVKSAAGLVIPNISGSKDYYEIDYVETNHIVVEFHSNSTSTSIGSLIRNVRVIY